MALHFPLYVNDEKIGHLEAVLTSLRESGLGTYQCKVYRPNRGTLGFTVAHQRDDGPWELIRIAMQRVVEFDRGEA